MKALIFLLLSLPAFAAVSVRDDRGQTITLKEPARRIITLSPHVTENLFAIGAGKVIVGTVNYSDYPEAAKAIERVGGYNGFDLERIRALKPDLIVAWQSGNPGKQLAMIEALGIPLYVDNARKLADVPTEMERLGVLTGHEAGARVAAAQFRDKIAKLEKNYSGKKTVRVFYQVWDRPLMTINREQIISDAMRVCGAVNVFGDLPAIAPTIDEEAVLAANPDLIVTTDVHGAKDLALERWRRWPKLRAVERGNLGLLPRDHLNRAGPRIADGTEALCAAVDKARQ